MTVIDDRVATSGSGGLPDAQRRRDARFDDPAWERCPFYRFVAALYRIFERWVWRRVERVGGSWERRARARLAGEIVTGLLAPTNWLPGNPAALRRAVDTRGASVLDGTRNMARDLVVNRGVPSTVDRRPYAVGTNLGCTTGVVVHREEMFELLEYRPSTARVHDVPLVMIPPPANRHYVLDLAPGRSLVEWTVAHGVRTFMVVWRNPSTTEHGRWGLDDHTAAVLRALEAAREVARTGEANTLGLCGGGIVTSVALAHGAASGGPRTPAATFLATMLLNVPGNVIGMLTPPFALRYLARAAARGKVFSGRALLRTFAWVRPADFVFPYVVDGWLMGRTPEPFDVLAWNADATRASSALVHDVARLVLGDGAARAGGASVLGVDLDFSAVAADSFHVLARTDHLVPWRASHATTHVLGGRSEAVLSEAGHILSFVAPPGGHRKGYWADGPSSPDPDEWLAGATFHDDSWWPRWVSWLVERSGPTSPAPGAPGSALHPPRGPAPGRYVHE